MTNGIVLFCRIIRIASNLDSTLLMFQTHYIFIVVYCYVLNLQNVNFLLVTTYAYLILIVALELDNVLNTKSLWDRHSALKGHFITYMTT